jgi:hypothetical protein
MLRAAARHASRAGVKDSRHPARAAAYGWTYAVTGGNLTAVARTASDEDSAVCQGSDTAAGSPAPPAVTLPPSAESRADTWPCR